MSPEVKYSFIEDISLPNEVLRIEVSSQLGISASVWTLSRLRTMAEARLECLQHAIGKITTGSLSLKLWLVAGNKVHQPDNRITRYNGLWGSLHKQGLDEPPADFFEEITLSINGIRHFGAAHFEFKDLKWALEVMSREQAAILLLQEQTPPSTLLGILRHGWAIQNVKPPLELLESSITHKFVLVDVYGEFDDCDVAVAAFGSKERVVGLNT